MIHSILKWGDPRLLRIARPVDEPRAPALQTLIDDLFETMHAANGAGLAAPQIGVDLRVVIFGFDKNPRYPDAKPVPPTVIINPVIEPLTTETELGFEGCLSVPGLRAEVARIKRLKYRGFDRNGQAFEVEAEGFHARVVQHEFDHLDGILYPMRVKDFTRMGFTEVMFPNLTDSAED